MCYGSHGNARCCKTVLFPSIVLQIKNLIPSETSLFFPYFKAEVFYCGHSNEFSGQSGPIAVEPSARLKWMQQQQHK